MTEKDWKHTRIRIELITQMQRAVNSIKIRNVPKYDSVPDFVSKACIMLLDQEGVKTH